MRECQLCGVKSWGPLTACGRALLLNAVRPEASEVDFTAYRECDNCTMPALTEIIEKPADIPTISAESAFTAIGLPPLPSSPDYVGMVDKMVAAMNSLPKPEPETRLERIVRAIISAHRGSWPSPISIVSQALVIEQEMGKVPTDTGTTK